jgi:hypothetical protein
MYGRLYRATCHGDWLSGFMLMNAPLEVLARGHRPVRRRSKVN